MANAPALCVFPNIIIVFQGVMLLSVALQLPWLMYNHIIKQTDLCVKSPCFPGFPNFVIPVNSIFVLLVRVSSFAVCASSPQLKGSNAPNFLTHFDFLFKEKFTKYSHLGIRFLFRVDSFRYLWYRSEKGG
jgi:hypothetical protein